MKPGTRVIAGRGTCYNIGQVVDYYEVESAAYRCPHCRTLLKRMIQGHSHKCRCGTFVWVTGREIGWNTTGVKAPTHRFNKILRTP
jgi:hypothetical protein